MDEEKIPRQAQDEGSDFSPRKAIHITRGASKNAGAHAPLQANYIRRSGVWAYALICSFFKNSQMILIFSGTENHSTS